MVIRGNKGNPIFWVILHKIRLFSWNLTTKFYALHSFLLLVLEWEYTFFCLVVGKRVFDGRRFCNNSNLYFRSEDDGVDFGRVMTRIS
jgi:hypothetical protein